MCRAFPLICWLWVFLLLAHTPLAAGSGERDIWIFLRDKIDEQGRVVQWHMRSQSHSIAEWDLPVRAEYIENVRQTGADIRTTSRWFNALSARVTPDQESALRTLPCVQSIGSVLKLQRPQPATLVDLPAGRLAHPSVFDVQADSFFVGKTTTQFISGSSGQVEISSSNFHLTPEGDVTMSGIITAEGGNIGDFQIIDGQISGSNITLNANNSTIFKTDQGPGSDTGESNLALKNEYYLDFSPTVENPDNAFVKFGPNFTVDKDGILIASGATFIGTITASAGLIGGFTTDSHSFSSANIFISGSPKTGGLPFDEYMFISTSRFNVKENGDVTGSQVLFTGGKIAGFDIDGTKLQQGTAFHLDGNADTDFFISSSN